MTIFPYINHARQDEAIATGSIDAFWELHRQELDYEKQLAKQSLLKVRTIARTKEKFPVNSKGHLRTQYFNKVIR